MKKIMRKMTTLGAAIALTLSLAGCGVSVTGATLDLPDTLERGDTVAATPEFAYDGATPESADAEKLIDKLELSYTSSNPDVVIVDADGNIAAVGVGTAEVALSSKDGKITASKEIEVVVSPTGITMPDSINLTMGEDETASLDAAVVPEDATSTDISYTSSDSKVVTVDADGKITAVAAGEATITASVKDTDVTAECRVTVNPAVEEEPESDTQLVANKSGKDNTDKSGSTSSSADSSNSSSASGSSNSGNSSSGSTGDMNDAAQKQAAESGATSFEYGGLPFDPNSANPNEVFYIDTSDNAYWACANNINAMRRDAGLPELTLDSGLSATAANRAVSMMTTEGNISHAGQVTAGEIIEAGAGSASVACQDWKNSSGHYAVITNASYTSMGVGCAFTDSGYTCWVVVFN